MKKTLFILSIFASIFVSCEDDENLEVADENAIEFEGKNAVIRSEDLSNLRFKNVPGSISLDESTPEGEIRVQASEDLEDFLDVEKEGEELRIEGKEGLPSTIDLNFYMNPLDVARIVVEGDNKVLITSTPVLDYLELVTQGESELVIHDLKVRNLVSRREGKSRMFLSSELTDYGRDSVYFVANSVQVLDETYLIYTEDDIDYLLFAPKIRVSNDSVFALGNDAPLRSFFITETHELRNEGESFLDALELPTLMVTSRNEGESESKVWAMEQLNVKGEGESAMYYIGNTEVNKELNGSASLIKL